MDCFVKYQGVMFALTTVSAWALLNVVNRFCVLQFDIDVIVFTAFMIFSTGVGLMLIRQPVTLQEWRNGVRYSWLYTIMQIIRSFTMISTFLYITSTETSLLFNIEIIIAYLFAYLIFKRVPYWKDYIGVFIIITGFVLFVFTLDADIRGVVTILILISSSASCIRSIVVEETTIGNPLTTVRQKCGISGHTMFYGGLFLILFLWLTAVARMLLGDGLFQSVGLLRYLPGVEQLLKPATIITACVSGFFINTAITFLYYSTLKHSTSETFMAIRAFQPMLTYVLEAIAAIFYVTMKPVLDVKDYLFGAVIIVGSFLILIIPKKGGYAHQSKDFITD